MAKFFLTGDSRDYNTSMMNYPIVKVKTEDGLGLHGLFTEPIESTKTIVIHIHGSAGNFYGNNYFEDLLAELRYLEKRELCLRK